jgi:YD repeat-containing protein
LSYRQRGAIHEDPAIFGVGSNWCSSFRAFIFDNDGGGISFGFHHGGAGVVEYTVGVHQYDDYSLLTPVTGGYQIQYRDGAIDTFTEFFVMYDTTNVGCYFLTAQSDPAGNTTLYEYANYPSAMQLRYVVDPDGNTNSLYYENTTFTNLITKVVDPWLRTNLLAYDQNGYLTNTTDPVGVSTSFIYDSTYAGWIDSMTTPPYGTTSFAYGGQDANNTDFYTGGGVVNRFITITLPTGGNYLYLYRQDCSQFMPTAYSGIPSTYGLATTLDNIDQENRNSFEWDPMQYQYLTTPVDPNNLQSWEYAIGHLRHWLIDPSSPDPSHTLSLEQLPSPDGGTTAGEIIWYDYGGKPTGHTNEIGTNNLPSLVARVLPDTTTRLKQVSLNPFGYPGQEISTYSLPNGNVALRTNTFYYGTNDVDLYQWVGPNNEQVVSNYFSTGNTFHKPDASYDALGQQTTFTYNSYGQVTQISRPTGLATINIYAAAGPGINRITNTTELQISRTNVYTYYPDGLINTHTDERGLTTTMFWDNLQRPTGVSYPDTTTTSNLYTALDLTGVKDRLGNWTSYQYNALREKIAETDANSNVTLYGYCPCGALTSVTNGWNTPVQMVTRFAYDYQGNLTYTYLPDATFTTWFNSMRQVVQTSDSRGYRLYGYNNQGLLTTVSNLYGAERAAVFDKEDRPLYVTDANGVTVTNNYDLLSRLTSRSYPDTGTEKFGYSARGLIAYTNQIGASNFLRA